MHLLSLLLVTLSLQCLQGQTLSPDDGTFVIYVNDFNNQKFYWLYFKTTKSFPKGFSYVDVLRKEGDKELLDIRVKPDIQDRTFKVPLFPIENSESKRYYVFLINKKMQRTYEFSIRVLQEKSGFIINDSHYIVGPMLDQY